MQANDRVQSSNRSSQLQDWRVQGVQQGQNVFNDIPIGRLQREDQHQRGPVLPTFGTHASDQGSPTIPR
jgi:hypothetical protein